MEKRSIIIGIGIVSIISLISITAYLLSQKTQISEEALLKIKEIEIRLEKNGIKNIAGFYPKYEKIEVNYYYKYDYCFNILQSTIQKFNGLIEIVYVKKLKEINDKLLEELNVQDSNINLPITVFNGKADIYDFRNNYIKSEVSFKTLISSVDACSEKILTYNLCSVLRNDSGLCNEISSKEEFVEAEKSIPSDFLCYDFCNIKYLHDNKLFSLTWQGLPCNRIDGYVEGESKVKSKQCYGNSCKSDANDLGCCKPTECVDNGKCYPLSVTKDIDSNGQTGICTNINNVGVWINPDASTEACTNANFRWFNCFNEEECKYGINNYIKKSNGLCCGDDKGEYANKCKGKICNSEDDFACCGANSCTLNGKCYQNGCNRIESNTGQLISAFCDGDTNTWTDLDNGHCAECLGKNAWSGTICCGDDSNEGEYPIRFVFNNKNDTINTLFYGCANKKSDCVYPNTETSFKEGLYDFKEDAQYIQGGYYCKKSQWYSLDNNPKYCKQAGYNWDENKGLCCGNNANEFFIKGSDGTSACCRSPNDIVINGECNPTTLCGNNMLDSSELCELPNSENNTYCQQSQQQCLGNKLGVRDHKGYCNNNCLCQGDEFSYSCVKNSCGAECSNDNGCGEGNKCDLNSCSCKPKTYCGDTIVQSYNDFAQKEECELPNTINNTYCKIEQCKDKKSIFGVEINYNYGICKNNCQCYYGSVDYICKRNQCEAECNEDGSGCSNGLLCNTKTCTCYSLTVCGNEICEEGEQISCPSDCKKSECPYRIDLKLDKNNYYLNDTINLEVVVYDKNNNPLPETKFDLDIIVNDVLVGSSAYETASIGSYVIKKKVNNFAPSGTHKYIAKAKVFGCEIVSDTEIAYLYVNNPYTIPTPKINYSRFDFIIDKFNFTNDVLPAPKCGDNLISSGESCEGNNVCRLSIGCDYKNKIYDIAEYCSICDCPSDKKSKPNDETYCSKCSHCGDDVVNCNEECENGTIDSGPICRDVKLYEKLNACSNCKWIDDDINSDILIDTCECKCPKNPEMNCVNGDYINYTSDYYAGCSDGKCNSCNCVDTYTKDSNNNGIEDKCEPELCANKIDDNDNGQVDEEGCIWYYCSQCGYGLFNFCTRQECSKFEQGCFFNKFSLNILSKFNYTIGSCNRCSSINTCEAYGIDNVTCYDDPCFIGSCNWDGKQCCTDYDNDNVCDSIDNCLNIFNPYQENSDKDSKGDACELCIKEPLLFEPTEQKEISCNDNIDNDCDGLADCQDSDCVGRSDCCQTVNDCQQSSCVIESCVNNKCNYQNRYFCDNTECPKGRYCDFEGECKEPDESSNICLYCILDATSNDYGISYGNLFSANSNSVKSICCGKQANEYYIVQKETNQSACCNSATSCVDYLGKCHQSNTPSNEAHNWHCSINLWYECSSNRNVLCAEAGSTYNYNITYRTNNETGWYCTYDGTNFGWRKNYPKENCYDRFDNDCDSKIDFDDEECTKTNITIEG